MKFVERIRSLRPQAVDILSTRIIFAVGTKTKTVLESSGFSVSAAPTNASAKDLVALLRAQALNGMKILFPKGTIARDTLPEGLRALGAAVEEVVVYQTAIPAAVNVEGIQSLLMNHSIDAVTFFSPSSIFNFAELIDIRRLENLVVGVIGPTTAEAAAELGIRPAVVATQASSEGMTNALEAYFLEKTTYDEPTGKRSAQGI